MKHLIQMSKEICNLQKVQTIIHFSKSQREKMVAGELQKVIYMFVSGNGNIIMIGVFEKK